MRRPDWLKRRRDSQLQRISKKAAEWFVRLEIADLSEREQRRFRRWLNASQRHREEFLNVRAMYYGLRDAGVPTVAPDALESKLIYFPLKGVAMRAAGTHAKQVSEPSALQFKVAAAIATLIASALLAAIVHGAVFSRAFQTKTGEWRRLTLADGSELTLAPNTRIRIEFGDHHRSIIMERGAVYSKVAKDHKRPFSVNAEPIDVRALGTAFGVARRHGEVVVTVREGVVNVSPTPKAVRRRPVDELLEAVSVTAGEQVTISNTWPVKVKQVNPNVELAWTHAQFEFQEGITLAELIRQFNYCNIRQMQVQDPWLGAHRVLGRFDASDPEGFATYMGRRPDIDVVRDRAGVLQFMPEDLPRAGEGTNTLQ